MLDFECATCLQQFCLELCCQAQPLKEIESIATVSKIFLLTLSLPRVSKIKIQENLKFYFVKQLKYKWYHVKVLLMRFHLNSHTTGFHP